MSVSFLSSSCIYLFTVLEAALLGFPQKHGLVISWIISEACFAMTYSRLDLIYSLNKRKTLTLATIFDNAASRPRIGEVWRRIRLLLVLWRSSTFLACLKGLTLNFFKVFLLLPHFCREKEVEKRLPNTDSTIVYAMAEAAAKEGL